MLPVHRTADVLGHPLAELLEEGAGDVLDAVREKPPEHRPFHVAPVDGEVGGGRVGEPRPGSQHPRELPVEATVHQGAQPHVAGDPAVHVPAHGTGDGDDAGDPVGVELAGDQAGDRAQAVADPENPVLAGLPANGVERRGHVLVHVVIEGPGARSGRAATRVSVAAQIEREGAEPGAGQMGCEREPLHARVERPAVGGETVDQQDRKGPFGTFGSPRSQRQLPAVPGLGPHDAVVPDWLVEPATPECVVPDDEHGGDRRGGNDGEQPFHAGEDLPQGQARASRNPSLRGGPPVAPLSPVARRRRDGGGLHLGRRRRAGFDAWSRGRTAVRKASRGKPGFRADADEGIHAEPGGSRRLTNRVAEA